MTASPLEAQTPSKPEEPRSLWLLLSLVASRPQMGESFGGLDAYVHVFEPQSRMSMFGAIFTGVGCLQSDRRSCTDSDDVCPSCRADMLCIVKPEEHVLLNLEYARGPLDDYGVYLTLGDDW